MLPRCLPGNQAKLHAELLGAPAEDQVTSSPTGQLVVDESAQELLCSSHGKQACWSPESGQQAHQKSQEAQESWEQEPSDACSQMLAPDRAVSSRKRKENDELQKLSSISWLPNAGAWAESLPAPSRGPHVNVIAEVGGRQAEVVQPDTSSKRRKQHPELRPQALQEQQQQAVAPSAKSAGDACSDHDHAAEAGVQLQCQPSGSIAKQVHGSTVRQHPGSSQRPAAAGKQQPSIETASGGGTQRRTLAGLATAGEMIFEKQIADCSYSVRPMDVC